MLLAILASQGIGFGMTTGMLLFADDPAPPSDAALWALGAGAAGVLGLGAFYLALSRGTMGLIAPLTALIGAGVPAVVGIAAGETVGPLSMIGILVALVAVVLISLPGGENGAAERRALRIDLRDLPLVLVSGLGFAAFFVLLDRADSAGGGIWWSLFYVRLIGLAIIASAVAFAIARTSGHGLPARASRALRLARLRDVPGGPVAVVFLFALAGTGDFGGNAFFFLANELDSLPVAAVLSSLYPVVTTAFAAALLHERLRPIQLLGVVLAVAGVALIGAGDTIAPAEANAV